MLETILHLASAAFVFWWFSVGFRILWAQRQDFKSLFEENPFRRPYWEIAAWTLGLFFGGPIVAAEMWLGENL